MSRTPDYNHCYQLLELEPGAGLALIEDNWKLLAFTWHPDRFAGTKFEQKATRRLQDINNARDILKSYWLAHGVAPPASGRSAHAQPGAQEPAGQKWQEPPPPASPQKPASFGPPAFKKNIVHRIFDSLDELERAGNPGLATGVMLALPILAVTGITVLLKALSTALGLPESILFENMPAALIPLWLWVIAGYLIFAGSSAYYKSYKIEENPYLEHSRSGLSADYLARRIIDALKECPYKGRNWEIEARKPSAGELTTVTACMRIEEKLWRFLPATYCLTFTARIQDRQENTACLVGYWFETKGSVWKAPLAKVLQETDLSLRKKLRGSF